MERETELAITKLTGNKPPQDRIWPWRKYFHLTRTHYSLKIIIIIIISVCASTFVEIRKQSSEVRSLLSPMVPGLKTQLVRLAQQGLLPTQMMCLGMGGG